MNEIIFDETNGMIFDEFIQDYPDFIDVLKKFDTDTFPKLVEDITLFQNAKNEIEESEIANRIQYVLFQMLEPYELVEPNEEVRYYKVKKGSRVHFIFEDETVADVTSRDMHMGSSWLLEIRNYLDGCEQNFLFKHMMGCLMTVHSSDIEELNYEPEHLKDICSMCHNHNDECSCTSKEIH